MPATWTQADIDTLKAAIVGGVKKVIYDGPPKREVEYQSLSEMRALLADMVSQVNGSASPSRRLSKTKKGFRNG